MPITRTDLSSTDLRREAARSHDADATWRLLAIALVLDAYDRASAAELCAIDRQALGDWILRYNAEGISGLVDRHSPGRPARTGGLVLPHADTGAMNLHLYKISTAVAPGAQAVLILDGAGWHTSGERVVLDNLTLLFLPPTSPGINSAANIGA